MKQGPPDKFEVMQSLFNTIPRNADHDAVLWTTVDPNKTNVRAKAVYKMLKGFSLYLLLMGKNILLESKTEQRYRDLMIVCNVQASSGPPDMEGIKYMAKKRQQQQQQVKIGRRGGTNNHQQQQQQQEMRSMQQAIEDFENGMDEELFRKGVMRSDSNPKWKSKVRGAVHATMHCCPFAHVTPTHAGRVHARARAPETRTRSCGHPSCTLPIPWREPCWDS